MSGDLETLLAAAREVVKCHGKGLLSGAGDSIRVEALRRELEACEPGELGSDAHARLAEIARIIELGDQRLLAADGPAAGQPPDLTLDEWRRIYELANGEAE